MYGVCVSKVYKRVNHSGKFSQKIVNRLTIFKTNRGRVCRDSWLSQHYIYRNYPNKGEIGPILHRVDTISHNHLYNPLPLGLLEHCAIARKDQPIRWAIAQPPLRVECDAGHSPHSPHCTHSSGWNVMLDIPHILHIARIPPGGM